VTGENTASVVGRSDGGKYSVGGETECLGKTERRWWDGVTGINRVSVVGWSDGGKQSVCGGME
jgi:hypothetical protein